MVRESRGLPGGRRPALGVLLVLVPEQRLVVAVALKRL